MQVKTKNKPVTVKRRYQAEVSGLGHAGEGVARVENFTIFVPGAVPGDQVTVEVEEVRRNFARGRLIRIDKPSPSRVTPRCGVHDTCGGCQLQMFDYESQLEWKQRRVREELRRIGGLDSIEVRPVLGMEFPFAYRNKAQYPVARNREGRIILGFYRRGTHDVVEAPQGCLVDHPLNTKVIQAAARLFNELKVSVYDERTGTGLFRHVVTRTSVSRGQVMVVFVTNGYRIPQQNELINGLREAVPELVSIAQNVNTQQTNVIFGPQTKILWGQPVIEDTIGHLDFEISPRSFFQVNAVQTAVLYETARDFAGLTGDETVVDGYCGIGTIALYLADQAQMVIGIEDVPEAIDDARRNAHKNNIHNVEFHIDKVEHCLPRLVKEGFRPNVVVLDPPRKGVDRAVLEAIHAAGVLKVVYVSCNPSSLARDLGYLNDMGYEIQVVQPVDMFPHTFHVECAALLKRKHS